MNHDALKRIEVGDKVIEIGYELNPMDPRTSQDNLGLIVAMYGRYKFPNELGLGLIHDDHRDWGEVIGGIRNRTTWGPLAMVLPIYMHDHSGVALSATYSPWAGDQVGFILATERAIKENWNVTSINADHLAMTAKILRNEVAELQAYMNGEVYHYAIYKHKKCGECGHVEAQCQDSCGGYYSVEEAEQAARESIK